MSKAIKLLRESGASFFIHCGDIGDEPCIDLLAGLPSAFVWGNCDWDRQRLGRYAAKIGVRCLEGGGELPFDEKRIFVTHGDDAALKQRVLGEQRCDYFLQGHTHVRHDSRVDRVRVINPGALHRAAVKTVALIDTDTDDVKFLTISAEEK